MTISKTKKLEKIVDSSKSESYKRLIPITAILIIVTAIISLALCVTTSTFTSATDIVLTFWISLLIGLGGAGVYLSLFLMTEKHLDILRNKEMDSIGFMTFLFLLSGGFVAAVTQVSTGPLQNGGVQAVFLVGFGWLGALSGVASVGERADLNLENKKLTNQKNAAENERKSSDGLKEENEDLKKTIEELYKRLSGGGG